MAFWSSAVHRLPLVLAHRGASGYRPEHTLAAYELSVAMGADYIEPDLVMTADGVLVDRHEPEIGSTTDVARRPEFADRRATKWLDGQEVTGWWAEDFTLAEFKTLRAIERLPTIRPGNTAYDGQQDVPTFEELLVLRERLSAEHGREIGIIPEIKHSTYLHALGFDPEAATMALVDRFGLNHRAAPLWIQSFEVGNLVRLREEFGYAAALVFLNEFGEAPYDFVAAGDPRTYADLLTADSLAHLAQWVDAIGPEKDFVIPRDAAGRLGQPTSLVDDAHRAGILVTPWTFRAENHFLPTDYRLPNAEGVVVKSDHGRAIDEALVYLEAGIDGMFCDNTDVFVAAKARFLA
ncbi:MAG: glycerophosphodiester phosphodiesterase family protein [Nocardioides sp.]